MASVQIQLGPARGSRISFWVQLMLSIIWILYGGALLFAENPTDDQNYLHFIFLTLALAYLFYLVANYTPLFGVQAYIQVTPEYLVQKPGLFREKLPIPFGEVDVIHLATHGMHIKLQNRTSHYIDFAQIKKPADRKRLIEEIRQSAETHGFALTQGPSLPR